MEIASNYNLGIVIAVRELDFNDDGQQKKISIKIGKPRKDKQPGGDYYCPFVIMGIGKENVQAAHGVDSIQAIELAFTMIGALINIYYQKLYPNKITWNNSPWLGFSSPDASEQPADQD